MSQFAWPAWMGPRENYLLPAEPNRTPPRVQHIGPLIAEGITFPFMKAEEFTDGEGFAPNPFGLWTCVCGWKIGYGCKLRTPSRALSPDAQAAFAETRARALWHAERCDGMGRYINRPRGEDRL